ncbi:type IV pilus assembly protein PilM [Hippea jasoniae]|uniref:type IV pilus assembly protein PilM n=1 Tax=Hippea jasoniae TaxID=944479 RepID=UPI00054F4954|nr:type IV pilus assembly protein PilM [Hippea jasoniae]
MAKGIVGIDIGREYTKVVYFNEKKGIVSLSHAFREETPEGMILSDGVDEEIMVDFLKNIFSTHKLKNKHVAISLNSAGVITKTLTMPLVADEEIKQAIMWEAEQYAPFGMEQVNVDYHVFEKNEEKKEMTVLIAIAKRDIIDAYKNAFKKARLRLDVVDVDVFALYNAFEVNQPEKAKQHSLLVDLGYSSTKLIFVNNGLPVFSRYIDFGFSYIVDEAVEILDVKQQEIELILNNHKHEKHGSLINFINDKLAGLYAQLSNSITFYKANILEIEEDVDNVVFSGILGALFDEIDIESARNFINIDIVSFNPFDFATKDGVIEGFEEVNSSVASFYCIAAGLSVRGLR